MPARRLILLVCLNSATTTVVTLFLLPSLRRVLPVRVDGAARPLFARSPDDFVSSGEAAPAARGHGRALAVPPEWHWPCSVQMPEGGVRTRWKWLIGALTVVLVLAYVVAVLIDEPLRRTIEGQMNARLKGYTARIGYLNFHPIGFSLDLRDLILVQDAHPDPPVLRVPRLSASVQWSTIIHGRVVADFLFDAPEVHVDRTHLVRELEDPTPVKEHGWQEALEAIYPLRINELRIRDGTLTYVDAGQARPLSVRHIEAVVNDVRNVRSAPDVYPSPVRVTAQVFEQAGWRSTGARISSGFRTSV